MLTARELLTTVESIVRYDPVRRSCALAMVASGQSFDTIAALPVGERDKLVFEFCIREVGPTVECFERCPTCDAEVELAFSLRELLSSLPEAQTGRALLDGDEVDVHPVSSSVLLDAMGASDPRVRILSRCTGLPRGRVADHFDELRATLSETDPSADVELAMCCPECGSHSSVPFDIVAYTWSRLRDAYRRVLLEVHRLARAYGWSEATVLELSEARRRAYLQLVR